MAWNDFDTRSADERTADYFRDKMANDPQNAAFWAAVEHETRGRWHLDRWEDAALKKPTLEWLEREIYPRCNATQECEKSVLRMLCFLCKETNIAWDTGIYRNICRTAKHLREKGWKPGEPTGLETPPDPATEHAPEPPPDGTETDVKKLDARQRIFIRMLLWQWKVYYAEGRCPSDEEAARKHLREPYSSERSLKNAYNCWVNKQPDDLRPVRDHRRGGKRSSK